MANRFPMDSTGGTPNRSIPSGGVTSLRPAAVPVTRFTVTAREHANVVKVLSDDGSQEGAHVGDWPILRNALARFADELGASRSDVEYMKTLTPDDDAPISNPFFRLLCRFVREHMDVEE